MEMLRECGGGQLILSGSARRLSEAVRALECTDRVDVVLLDLALPDSRGIDTFLNLSKAVPDLPVVILSGYDDETLAMLTVQQGAQDYLVKYELTGKLLVRSIHYAIERKHGEVALKAAREELERRIQGRTHALLETNRRLSETLNQLSAAQNLVIQQERMNAMERMANGIAHDFNNALSPIVAHSEWLLRKPDALTDEAGLKNALTKIHQSAESCAEIVVKLRHFCRSDAENGALERLDAAEIIRDAIALTQPCWKDQAQIRGCNITMETHFSPVPPIYGIREELREMFADLLLNATDAIRATGVITASVVAEGGRVTARIADNGVGMSQAVATQCMEPFFTTKQNKGTGLGLGVVQGIARRHSAEIEIESQEGAGTTVTVRFPDPQTGGEPSSPEMQAASAPLPTTVTGLRILAVEDEANIREILAIYLAEDGHQVEVAANGTEALAKLTPGRFDLLITDYSMPNMNGDRLAATVRTIDPEVRIALLTGFGAQLPQRSPLRLDVDAIISKPFTFESLRQGIAEAIEGKR